MNNEIQGFLPGPGPKAAEATPKSYSPVGRKPTVEEMPAYISAITYREGNCPTFTL